MFLPQDLDLDELTQELAGMGVRPDVARKAFARIQRGGAIDLDGVAGVTNAAHAAFRERAAFPELEVIERRRASDGFVKYLFRLADGPVIEAVRIPLPDPKDVAAMIARREAGKPAGLQALPAAKYTVCVSSQAGCALACSFCSTGRLGAIRSLATWEILAQVRTVAAEADRPVRGVVFQGMGEPFLNYRDVIRTARILSHPAGFGISARAITISTAGVVPSIRRFTEEGHRFRLIVSLGAARPQKRASLMPIENRWPLPELLDAVRAYADASRQRVTFSYVAIGGPDGNTSPEDARALGALLAGLKAKVNLIDVNDDTGQFRPPTVEELNAFRDVLAPMGFPIARRYSGGGEIGAACGRLAGTRAGGVVQAG